MKAVRLRGPRIVLSAVRHGGVLPGMLLGIAHVRQRKARLGLRVTHQTSASATAAAGASCFAAAGGLHFSTPVGEDVERRQNGGMSPDYSWVPVGASWKTRVIGRFPKN